MYLLDTNTCIQFISGTSPAVKENFKQHAACDLVLCSVVKAELFFGARKSQRIEENLLRPLHERSYFSQSFEIIDSLNT